MAAWRLSSLLCRSLSSGSASKLISQSQGRSVSRFSTASAAEELITPPVQIQYTKHLINGNFVDASSDGAGDVGIFYQRKTAIEVYLEERALMILVWSSDGGNRARGCGDIGEA